MIVPSATLALSSCRNSAKPVDSSLDVFGVSVEHGVYSQLQGKFSTWDGIDEKSDTHLNSTPPTFVSSMSFTTPVTKSAIFSELETADANPAEPSPTCPPRDNIVVTF